MAVGRHVSMGAALVVAIFLSGPMHAQGIDYARIEILTEKVAPNLYNALRFGGGRPRP
jgi:hypothetical protein